jgi:hypothetical protein
MKLDFPKIVREINLSDYAPEVNSVIYVWVNPSMQVLMDLSSAFENVDADDNEKHRNFLAVVSQLLSQGNPETHFTVDELQQLFDGTKDTDPTFWTWLMTRILKEIGNHRLGIKKN